MRGPAEERLADNLRRLRTRAALSYTELSQRLAALGWPIGAEALGLMEHVEHRRFRQMRAADCIALALALGVSPLLLLVRPDPGAQVQRELNITPALGADESDVFHWMQNLDLGFAASAQDAAAWESWIRARLKTVAPGAPNPQPGGLEHLADTIAKTIEDLSGQLAQLHLALQRANVAHLPAGALVAEEATQ